MGDMIVHVPSPDAAAAAAATAKRSHHVATKAAEFSWCGEAQSTVRKRISGHQFGLLHGAGANLPDLEPARLVGGHAAFEKLQVGAR